MYKTVEDRRAEDGISEVKRKEKKYDYAAMLPCSGRLRPGATTWCGVGALSLFALSQRGNNNQGGEREGRPFEFSSPSIRDVIQGRCHKYTIPARRDLSHNGDY